MGRGEYTRNPDLFRIFAYASSVERLERENGSIVSKQATPRARKSPLLEMGQKWGTPFTA